MFRTRPKVKAPKRRRCPTPDLVKYRRQAAKAALRRMKRQSGNNIVPRHDRKAIWPCVCGGWHLTPLHAVKADRRGLDQAVTSDA